MEIITATLVVGVTGLVIGIALVFAGKKFHVETDERETEIREHLPGNNCGACGYAGCDAVAAAIAAGKAPVGACPVNSAENTGKIAAIMGVEAEASVRKIAVVRCSGDCKSTSGRGNYVGLHDCRAAVLAGISTGSCDYGCLGYGSCAEACTYGAMHVRNGVASADMELCTGCGACVKVCPKSLIELVPADGKAAVRCSNTEKGAEVKKVCSAGCIGCKLCEKQCGQEAVKVENFLAHIDYDRCTGCGECEEKCPSGVISLIVKK